MHLRKNVVDQASSNDPRQTVQLSTSHPRLKRTTSKDLKLTRNSFTWRNQTLHSAPRHHTAWNPHKPQSSSRKIHPLGAIVAKPHMPKKKNQLSRSTHKNHCRKAAKMPKNLKTMLTTWSALMATSTLSDQARYRIVHSHTQLCLRLPVLNNSIKLELERLETYRSQPRASRISVISSIRARLSWKIRLQWSTMI